ncbi:hypothetical protein BofuT4_P072460.1 [Botrytis cinerea T4]|uniref:Uncharacterized protein n=1 Tax=Botryotinia fuckeliana (strain T4) TaxID=999810 RepID=G2XPM3_BOTF4|nr:hypothetical protein BofuT4_P072460.1 [Botrytis cinerea T4]
MPSQLGDPSLYQQLKAMNTPSIYAPTPGSGPAQRLAAAPVGQWSQGSSVVKSSNQTQYSIASKNSGKPNVLVKAQIKQVYSQFVGLHGEHVKECQKFFGVQFANNYLQIEGKTVLILLVQTFEEYQTIEEVPSEIRDALQAAYEFLQIWLFSGVNISRPISDMLFWVMGDPVIRTPEQPHLQAFCLMNQQKNIDKQAIIKEQYREIGNGGPLPSYILRTDKQRAQRSNNAFASLGAGSQPTSGQVPTQVPSIGEGISLLPSEENEIQILTKEMETMRIFADVSHDGITDPAGDFAKKFPDTREKYIVALSKKESLESKGKVVTRVINGGLSVDETTQFSSTDPPKTDEISGKEPKETKVEEAKGDLVVPEKREEDEVEVYCP